MAMRQWLWKERYVSCSRHCKLLLLNNMYPQPYYPILHREYTMKALLGRDDTAVNYEAKKC